MVQPLNYLRETASQTAGPYVHIGLAPGAAGFEIFEKELGQDIAGPKAAGGASRDRFSCTARLSSSETARKPSSPSRVKLSPQYQRRTALIS